jgi:hypothetical protein
LPPQCIVTAYRYRSLVVGEHHTILQGRRQEHLTEAAKQNMKKRNTIEGTQSKLVWVHGSDGLTISGCPRPNSRTDFVGAAHNIKGFLRRIALEMTPPSLPAEPAATSWIKPPAPQASFRNYMPVRVPGLGHKHGDSPAPSQSAAPSSIGEAAKFRRLSRWR